MVVLATRVASGPAGTYYCLPPWTTFHACPRAQRMLGLDGRATLDVAEINAAQAHDGEIRYDLAIAETVRTGRPLVVTNAQRRRRDGVLRTLVTVTGVRSDDRGVPVRLQGHVVDITDDVCGGADLADLSLVGIVECGPTLVVLLCGEFDLSTRAQLADAMRHVLRSGVGPVYLDARHLRFCDAGSAGALIATARRLTERQRPVVLLQPSRLLQRMLHLIADGPPMATLTVPGLS